MIEEFIRRKELERLIGLGCSTIYAMMARDEFPRPLKLGRRAVGWRAADVETWIKQREGAAHD